MPHGIEIERHEQPSDRGGLHRVYRDGGIKADSRDYLMKVDAVGDGKGQPMQTTKLGNGGPTMRCRAILTGGR